MGGPVGSNETRDSGVSRYLYGKIIQEMCSSRYSADLAKMRLVITVVYSSIPTGLALRHLQLYGNQIKITNHIKYKSQSGPISPNKKITKTLRKLPRMRNIPYMTPRNNTYRHPQNRPQAQARNPRQTRRVVRSTDQYQLLPIRRPLQLFHIRLELSGRRQLGYEPTPLFLR